MNMRSVTGSNLLTYLPTLFLLTWTNVRGRWHEHAYVII